MGGEGERTAGCETVEHTADVGLRVWGPDLASLFEQAANGFIGLMLDPARVAQESERALAADGEGPEELLVAWLEEILFAFEAKGFAPALARVESLRDGRVEGRLSGEAFNPERHEVRNVVKAVTYHDLEVRRTPGGYEVTIIFDL